METELATSAERAHPWHGIEPVGADGAVAVYIENTQQTTLKYELDLRLGLLRIDQPLQTSAVPPCAYGFVPRTLCGDRVAAQSGRKRGDDAPLDVLVLSERRIEVPGVLCYVRIVGGIRVRDESRADDKLIGVLRRDAGFAGVEDIDDLPVYLLDRITHFLAQSAAVDGAVEVGAPYAKSVAGSVLAAAMEDYSDRWET